MQYFGPHVVQHATVEAHTTLAEVVAAPGAGRRIVVLGWMLTLDAAGAVEWTSATDSLTGVMSVGASTPFGFSNSLGVFTCGDNEALNLEATEAANGFVRYTIATF